MPLVSGLNGDNRNIPSGAPVAGKFNRLQLDTVVFAGSGVLAAGIVTSGAGVKGVINLRTDGVVDLDDWSFSTGSKYLTVGRVYRLSNQKGKLSMSGSGQIIGLAASKTELTLQISAGNEESMEAIATTNDDLAVEIAARIAGDGVLNALVLDIQNILQTQITELQQPVYARHLLLAGM